MAATNLELPGGIKTLNPQPTDPRSKRATLAELQADPTYYIGYPDIYVEETGLHYRITGGSVNSWILEEVGSELTADELAAINGSATPSVSNVFATMADSNQEPCIISLSDLTSNLEAIEAEEKTFHFAGKFTAMFIDVLVVATGANIEVDLFKNGVSIFTTVISIDATELSSSTATTPYVISGTANEFVAGDIFTWVIDQVGATIAGAGLSFSAIIEKA